VGQDGQRQRGNLAHAQALDRAALAAIYDEYHPLIYRYLYRQTGDVEVARDLSADVFQRLLGALNHRAGPQGQLAGWLYRTAHNLLVDYYRRQQYRRTLPLDEDIAVEDGDMGEAVDSQLTAEQVRAAVQGLSADQQQVIFLRFLEGLSNEEVARLLDKPVGAVKSLQHRALASLHRRLVARKEPQL
jgi:RNA polymerase sigma-70 factor (ECF subfamily)